MIATRRALLALGAAVPLLATRAAEETTAAPAADAARLWRNLFAGRVGETYAWWYQGTMAAHVDRLREFPVLGFHAIMIARTSAIDGTGGGIAVDFRTIGFFSDIDTGLPTATWHNVFTDRQQAVPPVFGEGPGRYTMTPTATVPTLTLNAAATRTNRAIVTGEISGARATLTQIEGTLQGFPRRDGTLPPLGSADVTERQTRLQIIAPRGAASGDAALIDARGFFSFVYDALPEWMGFGDTLGSGLSKGQMRKASADTVVDRVAWAHLRRHAPADFAGDRLVLR